MTGDQLGLLGPKGPRLRAPPDLDPSASWQACGQAALAAALGWDLAHVRPRLTHELGYMSPADMRAVIKRCGVTFTEKLHRWPSFGLAFVVFDGPWLEPGLPAGAAMRMAHWIAVDREQPLAGGEIYDVNCDRVVFFDFWCRGFAFDLARQLDKNATGGWSLRYGFELDRTPS